ncbi:MAG TPA: hypothetical protein VE422_38410, partial [Terriglobia bacterium]|nr:hypothetical protein [Terriglobia bacterium]
MKLRPQAVHDSSVMYAAEVFRGGLAPPAPRTFVAGARIDVTGTNGTKTISTDETGIYQLDGLPPGD